MASIEEKLKKNELWEKIIFIPLIMGVPLLVFLPGNPHAAEFLHAYGWGVACMFLVKRFF